MSFIETGFLYLGDGADVTETHYAVKVPYPDKGPFATSRMVDAARNAEGELVGRMVGRSLDKQELRWDSIPCEDWWRMNRWFEAGHFSFYCRYFSHNVGRWQTRRFYLGDVKCEPDLVDPGTGRPAFYRSAAFSVIDCGGEG